MATDLVENRIEKCAEYLPPSATLDNHTAFGDYQITLKNREVKDKYALSTILLKNTLSGSSRELTHFWYKWPEIGVPNDESSIIAMLLEARSYLKAYAAEETNDAKLSTIISSSEQSLNKDSQSNEVQTTKTKGEINGNVSTEKLKTVTKTQGYV